MSETGLAMPSPAWGGGQGIAAAAKYNPHLWSADELRAIFVVRRRELGDILAALRAVPAGVVAQHLLITGQRGMGKSTLLQRVALAVEDDTALCHTWLALRFPEEQYTVSTPAELWCNVIGALADALERHGVPADDIDLELEKLAQMPQAQREEAALAWLEQWCQQRQKRLLLLMDSTDLIFSNLAGAAANRRAAAADGGASALWRVRKVLLHAPHLFWLGGSYQPLEVSGLYSDAFLEFFHLIELRPLRLDEMQAAILALARTFGVGHGVQGEAAAQELKRMLEARPERLRAMRQLTGGNPRTTIILYELFAAGGQTSVRADLERLLDAMTPLYKAKLEILADQMRKVLAHVMESWAPLTAKALADASGLAVGVVSTQLLRLEQEGLVEKVSLSGKKRQGYQVAERFFNIWYLMRNAPRSARARVGWLVEFMRLWYSKDEMQEMASVRWRELRGGGHCEFAELEYSRALARAMPESAQERKYLEWTVFSHARRSAALDDLFDLKGEDADYSTPAEYLARLDKLRDECTALEAADGGERAWGWRVLGEPGLSLSEKEALVGQCRDMNEEWRVLTWNALQKIWDAYVKYFGEDGILRLETAINNGEFFVDCLDAELAKTQIETCFGSAPAAFAAGLNCIVDQLSDGVAGELCEKALDLAPHSAFAWNCMGIYRKKTGKYVEAEKAFRKAIEFDKNCGQTWRSLGSLYQYHLRRYEEAEHAYRRANELLPDWAAPWGELGSLYQHHLQRYGEAEQAYHKANELNPDWGETWAELGSLYQHHLKRYGEAEQAYHKAIELKLERAELWVELGNLYQYHLQRYGEAEQIYRKAIELKPDWLEAWGRLGDLYRDHLKSYEESAQAYSKLIELKPDWAEPWGVLGDLYQDHLQHYEKSEQLYRKAIELKPQCAKLWVGIGRLYQYHLQRYEEAEQAYRRAIEIKPDWAELRGGLGYLYQYQLKRYEEAEQAYCKAIELKPDMTSAWYELGWLYQSKLKRNDAAEDALRKALELEPQNANIWNRYGNLLLDQLKRSPDAELAFKKSIELEKSPVALANLGRLYAAKQQTSEATAIYKDLVSIAQPSDNNVLFQAHCYLGNQELALQHLDTLAEQANKGNELAFYLLREQCFECHHMGMGPKMIAVLERSAYAGFLQPFALALRAAGGDSAALQDAPAEVRALAEDILGQIKA